MAQQIGKAKPHADCPLPVLVGNEAFRIQLRVGIKITRIDTVFLGEPCQKTVFRAGSAVKFVFAQRFLTRLSENDDETRNDADARGIAAEGDGAVTDLFAKGLAGGAGQYVAIDDLAVTRRQINAAFGSAGLGNDGVTLRSARHVERAFDVEIFSLMIDRLGRFYIPEAAFRHLAFAARIPARPELFRDIEKFRGLGISLIARRQRVVAEIGGDVRIEGGDDVDDQPTARDDIDGLRSSRKIIGRVIGGGDRRHKADIRHLCGKRCGEDERIDGVKRPACRVGQ